MGQPAAAEVPIRPPNKMRASLGCRTFHTAKATVAGIERVPMIRKGEVRPQLAGTDAEQFFALAA